MSSESIFRSSPVPSHGFRSGPGIVENTSRELPSETDFGDEGGTPRETEEKLYPQGRMGNFHQNRYSIVTGEEIGKGIADEEGGKEEIEPATPSTPPPRRFVHPTCVYETHHLGHNHNHDVSSTNTNENDNVHKKQVPHPDGHR